MPRKDGFQTCKDIRAWEAKQIEAGTARGNVPIPIVALSAYVMSDMVDKCRESGFTKYLSKPVVFQKLKGMIRTIFFLSRFSFLTVDLDVILELLGLYEEKQKEGQPLAAPTASLSSFTAKAEVLSPAALSPVASSSMPAPLPQLPSPADNENTISKSSTPLQNR